MKLTTVNAKKQGLRARLGNLGCARVTGKPEVISGHKPVSGRRDEALRAPGYSAWATARPESRQHMRDPGVVHSRSSEPTSGEETLARSRSRLAETRVRGGSTGSSLAWFQNKNPGPHLLIGTSAHLGLCASSQPSVNLVTSFHSR